jgi:CheY-like chemotaxis protein
MADTVEKAIALASTAPPDVILLDDDLDDPGHQDLAEDFRRRFPSAEMILLSSHPEETTRGIGLGLLFHGLRPVSTATLLDLVSGVLPGRLSTPAEPREERPMVLCVDDDRESLVALSRLLTRHGYRVATFDNPAAVLSAIPDVAPDLAIVDVLMPGLDGRELSRQIRERYRGMFPIIMYSGRANDAERAAGFRHGADYFLPKGCDPDQLLDVVDFYADRLDGEERRFLESRI